MHPANMHLLLVNPWIHDFAAYDFWLKPFGLLTIASILRKKGFDISFIDCLDRSHPIMLSRYKGKRPRKNMAYGHGQFFKEAIQKPEDLKSIPRRFSRYGISPDIFRQELKEVIPPPMAILITTTMTYWYPGTSETISILREIFPNTPIIIGGNYVTLCPKHAHTLDADYFIEGRGTGKVLKILSQITGCAISDQPDEADPERLPYPAFDLLHEKAYVPLRTSQGCPFHCSYCASNLLDHEIQRRSPKNVVREILHWVGDDGVKNVIFYDDALLYQPDQHIIPILEELIETGIRDITFHTPNGLHARFMSPKLAKLMLKTGFKTIRLGYETANPQRQSVTGAKVNDEELQAALAYLREAGFSHEGLGVYILIGLPGQKAKEVKESIRQVIRFGGIPFLSEFSPIPGTGIWHDACQYSRYDLENDPIFHNNSILPCEWSGFSWRDYLEIKAMVNQFRRDMRGKSRFLFNAN